MQLKKLDFRLNNLFKESQTIHFNKNKVCIIGNVATGKSTLLYSINRMLTNENDYRQNYFKVEESKLTFDIRLNDYVKNIFEIEQDYLEFEITGSIYSKVVYSPIFKEVLLNIIDDYNETYQKIKSKISEIRTLFNQFCIKKGYKNNNFYVVYERILEKDWREKDFDKVLDEVKEGYLKSRNGIYSLYGFNYAEYTVVKHSDAVYDGEFDYLEELFSKFFTKGKADHTNIIDEFNKAYPTLLDDLNIEIEHHNLVTERFNKVFGNYSLIYSYIIANATKNVILLNHGNRQSNSEIVLNYALKGIRKNVYKELIEEYVNDLEDIKTDYTLYVSLCNLKVIDSEFHNVTEECYEEHSQSYNDMIAYYENNKKSIIEMIENTFMERDILKDYSNSDEYFSEFYTSVKKADVTKKAFGYILETFPKDFTQTCKDLQLVEENNRVNLELLFDNWIKIDDLSSGTIWKLKFSLVKKLVTENDILLLDEPALFLHKNAQIDIVKEILNLNCKVIYTTHTPSLLPFNLDDTQICEVKRSDDTSTLVLLENDIEESLIDIFGLRYLQNVLVDYSRQVMLLENTIKDFDNVCYKYGIKNDLNKLTSKLSNNILDKLMALFNNYCVVPTVVVTNNKLYKELVNNKHNVIVYRLSDFERLLDNSISKELSIVLRGENDDC